MSWESYWSQIAGNIMILFILSKIIMFYRIIMSSYLWGQILVSTSFRTCFASVLCLLAFLWVTFTIIMYHRYADNTLIYLLITVSDSCQLVKLETCLSKVRHWMYNNILHWSVHKNEILLFWSNKIHITFDRLFH